MKKKPAQTPKPRISKINKLGEIRIPESYQAIDTILTTYCKDQCYTATPESCCSGGDRSFGVASSWLSWFTNRKDTNTTAAPIQYIMLAYCWYWIISPMSDSGIVRDKPTVTTKGVVSSMAYAQDMSLTKDASELAMMTAQILPVGGISNCRLLGTSCVELKHAGLTYRLNVGPVQDEK
jgi:hypothetical protein